MLLIVGATSRAPVMPLRRKHRAFCLIPGGVRDYRKKGLQAAAGLVLADYGQCLQLPVNGFWTADPGIRVVGAAPLCCTRTAVRSVTGGRKPAARHGFAYTAFRLTAEVLPLLPRSRSNETVWFSLNEPMPAFSTAEMWTKTSFEPSCGAMKPKPFVALKNFTVPVVDIVFLVCVVRSAAPDIEHGINMIHREKSRKRPERTPGELANNQSTAGVSPLGVILTSGIFSE
jgi:hypothetical protein